MSACGERHPAFGEAQVGEAGAEDDLRGQAGSPAVVCELPLLCYRH